MRGIGGAARSKMEGQFTRQTPDRDVDSTRMSFQERTRPWDRHPV